MVISVTLLKPPFFVCVSGVHNVDAAEEADGGLGEPGSEEDEEEYDSGGSGVALTPPDSPSPIDAAAQAAAANQGDKSRRIIILHVLEDPFVHRNRYKSVCSTVVYLAFCFVAICSSQFFTLASFFGRRQKKTRDKKSSKDFHQNQHYLF